MEGKIHMVLLETKGRAEKRSRSIVTKAGSILLKYSNRMGFHSLLYSSTLVSFSVKNYCKKPL